MKLNIQQHDGLTAKQQPVLPDFFVVLGRLSLPGLYSLCLNTTCHFA
jgi:hypothetical protein